MRIYINTGLGMRVHIKSKFTVASLLLTSTPKFMITNRTPVNIIFLVHATSNIDFGIFVADEVSILDEREMLEGQHVYNIKENFWHLYFPIKNLSLVRSSTNKNWHCSSALMLFTESVFLYR